MRGTSVYTRVCLHGVCIEKSVERRYIKLLTHYLLSAAIISNFTFFFTPFCIVKVFRVNMHNSKIMGNIDVNITNQTSLEFYNITSDSEHVLL